VSKTIDDARRLIESRLAEIEAEARRLEQAVASLDEAGPSRRGRRGRRRQSEGKAAPAALSPRRPASRKRKAGRRAARAQRREQLLAAIEATPGARPSELARSIGIRPTQVHALIAKARAEKLTVKSGQGYALKG
jgi:hypothetical protein